MTVDDVERSADQRDRVPQSRGRTFESFQVDYVPIPGWADDASSYPGQQRLRSQDVFHCRSYLRPRRSRDGVVEGLFVKALLHC